jgi:cold-inducible RNA-binding protein
VAKRLFVGNLPYSMTDDELREAFAGVGTVASANVIFDRATGRSKGFGFVEMSTDEEAAEAVKQLDGSDYQGRKFTVGEARPREERTDANA